MLGLRHLALRVHDIEKAVEFYSGILGMRIDWQPDRDNVYLTSGTDNLALHRCDEPTTGGSLDHLGFAVSRPEDVDEWASRLAQHGVPLVQSPRTHRDGSRSIYFRDSEANLIQLLFHPRITA